jgi:hypothetical protein
MILVILILMILAFLMLVIYEPYVDIFRAGKEYHIIIWYTNLDGERKFFNILGGN